MQSSLRAGDGVMLGAGIFATVVAVDDDNARVHVEVAPGTTLQVARGAIAQVVDPAEHPEDDATSGEVLDVRDDVSGDVHDDTTVDTTVDRHDTHPRTEPGTDTDARRGERGPRGDL